MVIYLQSIDYNLWDVISNNLKYLKAQSMAILVQSPLKNGIKIIRSYG